MQGRNDNKDHADSETITGPGTVQTFSYLQFCTQCDMWQMFPFTFLTYHLQGSESELKQQRYVVQYGRKYLLMSLISCICYTFVQEPFFCVVY